MLPLPEAKLKASSPSRGGKRPPAAGASSALARPPQAGRAATEGGRGKGGGGGVQQSRGSGGSNQADHTVKVGQDRPLPRPEPCERPTADEVEAEVQEQQMQQQRRKKAAAAPRSSVAARSRAAASLAAATAATCFAARAGDSGKAVPAASPPMLSLLAGGLPLSSAPRAGLPLPKSNSSTPLLLKAGMVVARKKSLAGDHPDVLQGSHFDDPPEQHLEVKVCIMADAGISRHKGDMGLAEECAAAHRTSATGSDVGAAAVPKAAAAREAAAPALMAAAAIKGGKRRGDSAASMAPPPPRCISTAGTASGRSAAIAADTPASSYLSLHGQAVAAAAAGPSPSPLLQPKRPRGAPDSIATDEASRAKVSRLEGMVSKLQQQADSRASELASLRNDKKDLEVRDKLT